MKRLGFRAAFLSTDKKVKARTKRLQTTEPQLFYIVCCQQFFIHYQSNSILLNRKSFPDYHFVLMLQVSIRTFLFSEYTI